MAFVHLFVVPLVFARSPLKVRWLQEELSLSDNEVAAMISSAPNILTISIQGSMAPKLGWLSRRLMLSNEQLAMVVTACPQVPSNLQIKSVWHVKNFSARKIACLC